MADPDNKHKISAVILSAGRSERMGTPKFSLRFDSDNTFLQKIAWCYHDYGCQEIVIVVNGNDYRLLEGSHISLPPDTRIIVNMYPGREKFFSLKLALKTLEAADQVFVSVIDNPFVKKELFNALLMSDGDYRYPVYKGRGGHPFIISAAVVNDIIKWKNDREHLREFLGRYKSTAVKTDDVYILVNINTLDDYHNYFGKR